LRLGKVDEEVGALLVSLAALIRVVVITGLWGDIILVVAWLVSIGETRTCTKSLEALLVYKVMHGGGIGKGETRAPYLVLVVFARGVPPTAARAHREGLVDVRVKDCRSPSQCSREVFRREPEVRHTKCRKRISLGAGKAVCLFGRTEGIYICCKDFVTRFD